MPVEPVTERGEHQLAHQLRMLEGELEGDGSMLVCAVPGLLLDMILPARH
jgi:hypothetical protein